MLQCDSKCRIALSLNCKTKYNILFYFHCLLSTPLSLSLSHTSHSHLLSLFFIFYLFLFLFPNSYSLMAKPVSSQAKLILHNIYKTLTSQTYTPHTHGKVRSSSSAKSTTLATLVVAPATKARLYHGGLFLSVCSGDLFVVDLSMARSRWWCFYFFARPRHGEIGGSWQRWMRWGKGGLW